MIGNATFSVGARGHSGVAVSIENRYGPYYKSAYEGYLEEQEQKRRERFVEIHERDSRRGGEVDG